MQPSNTHTGPEPVATLHVRGPGSQADLEATRDHLISDLPPDVPGAAKHCH